MSREYKISHVGAQGDGVVCDKSGDAVGALYVPYTLDGEMVEAEVDGSFARLTKILTPSSKRISPTCRHFTRCGGCKLQHMQFDNYLEWKMDRVRDVFLKRGISCDIDPIWSAGFGHRRRAVFAASRSKKSVTFGFYQLRGTVIEGVENCPLLVPAINDHLGDLRDVVSHFMTRKSQIKVGVTSCIDGLDIWIEGGRAEHFTDIVERISGPCRRAGVLRVIVDDEILYQNGEVDVLLSGVRVPLPPRAFLQACSNAETRMVDIVCDKLSGLKSVADLFSGVGTFSFGLAAASRVLAVENSAIALNALKNGHDRATGIKPISTLNRDLMQDPMSANELMKIDGVVFDPPRAGAIAQAHALAKSSVRHVVAVSCNPNSLARDLKVLVDGGYEIRSVHPIDQFVYSPHAEIVTRLVRC